MRIITQNETGPSSVLKAINRPSPKPGAGELLVKMEAAGVNPVDAGVRAGAFELIGKPPFTVGWDVAGTVLVVGNGVTGFTPGDAVFGMPAFPKQAAAYADEVIVDAKHMARRPAALPVQSAGAIPLAGLTAWQALTKHGNLKSGQTVLIHAAAGGVGHLAVQIAKAMGAKVIATASIGKIAFVKSLGADKVIDYAANDFVKSAGKVSLVIDSIGGDNVVRSLDCIEDNGVVVCLLDPSEAAKDKAAHEGKRLIRMLVEPDAEGLAALAELGTSGKLQVHVEKIFPLEQAAVAHDFLKTNPKGKIVLVP